jgi:hypothetical protein
MMKGKDKVKQVLDAMHEVVVAWGKSFSCAATDR